MANFTTHLAIGTMASGMLATVTMAANVVDPHNIMTVCLAGALGSILPDIDLKDSRPSQAIFSGLAIFLAFVVLFNVAWKYSIVEMWILWLGTFLFVKFPGQAFFHRLSYHRGIYHSLLAAVFFALLTAVVYRWLFGANEGVSWLAAGFMFAGYLVHLTLDEIYSVDVMDVRIKHSFGTALKLYDGKHLGHSAAMLAAVLLVYGATPPVQSFWREFTSEDIWAGLHQRFLPHGRWFDVLALDGTGLPQPITVRLSQQRQDLPVAIPAGTPDIITGSLPSPAPREPKSAPASMLAPADPAAGQ